MISLFGFLKKGKIEIVVSRMNYLFNETISGTVKMQLNKPIEARGMRVKLVAEQEVYVRQHNGNYTKQTKTLYEFTQPLDGAKTYSIEPVEYKFDIKTPASLSQQGGIGMQLVSSGMSLLGTRPGPIRWWLDASLDIPKGFDVSTRLQITVG